MFKEWIFGKSTLPPQTKIDVETEIGNYFSTESFLDGVVYRFPLIQAGRSGIQLERIRSFISDGMFNRLHQQQKIREILGQKTELPGEELQECRVVGFEKDPYYDTVHVGIGMAGGVLTADVNEVWSFMRRPGVSSKGGGWFDEGNCPSCGAALQMTTYVVRCSSCNVLVNSGHYSWVLAGISDAKGWSPPSERNIPGLGKLQNADQSFCVQSIEDRMQSYFWKFQECLFTGQIGEIATVASAEFQEKFIQFAEHGTHRINNRSAYMDTQVSGIELSMADYVGNQVNLIFTVNWDAVRIEFDAKNNYRVDNQRSVKRQCFVMSRNINAVPRVDCGLSTLSCVNCGAPFSSSEGGNCDYCGSKLNSPEVDWVLEDIVYAYEVARLIREKRQGGDAAEDEDEVPLDMVGDRVGLLAGLIAVLFADGEFTPEEHELAVKFAQESGIGEEILQGIISDAQHGILEVHIPRSNEEARAWMKAFVDAGLADGDVDDSEMNFMINFGERFNLSRVDIQTILADERRKRHHQERQARFDQRRQNNL